MTKKEIFLGLIADSVSNLCYYDRKDDEDLSVDDVEELLTSGEVTLDEILETFAKEFRENYPDLKQN